MRLDKFLSFAGLGSRKKVSYLIRIGKVKVNSEVIKDPSFKIDPQKDHIELENRTFSIIETKFYYKFYKPKGFVTSTIDFDSTIMKLIPPTLPGYKKLFPVGRLDKDAEGLLILTSDGLIAHRILHPKWKVPKTYEIKITPFLKEKDKTQLEIGIELEEGRTLPCTIIPLNKEKDFLKITVYEGRYHLLKRMFKKLGYKVLNIKRVSIGPISIENLSPGEIRKLSAKEMECLRKYLNL